MLITQGLALPVLNLVQLPSKITQATCTPHQPKPQKTNQKHQRTSQPDIQLALQALVHWPIITHRLHGNNAIGRTAASQKINLDVINEKCLALLISGASEYMPSAIITRLIVNLMVCGRAGSPEQLPLSVINKAQLTCWQHRKLFIGQLVWHMQTAIDNPGCRHQRTRIRCQPLLDCLLQRTGKNLLQGWI